MSPQFPFSALVTGGDDTLSIALLLSAIDPAIGGVLIRGEKGTAKSTAVRSLSAVLPPISVFTGDRFSVDPHNPLEISPDSAVSGKIITRPVRLVELPVGATEDRLVGALHLEKVLSSGVTEFQPGLLAEAHRGILYVDEVNLLPDHLVDVLLDSAAMARASIERDSLSFSHPARFVLIGTMNPEEGELRPQLLDRFGLTVEVKAPRVPELRAEIVRRRLAFDADPLRFSQLFANSETELTAKIAAAQQLLPGIEISDQTLLTIAEICSAFDVDGMRADIVTARTAAAHAALAGRTAITSEDIRMAATLALPHRKRRNPFDEPGLDKELLDQILSDQAPDPDEPLPDDFPPDDFPPENPPPGNFTADNSVSSNSDSQSTEPPANSTKAQPSSSVTTVGDPFRAKKFKLTGVGKGAPGRRSPAHTESGRRVGSQPITDGAAGRFDVLGTVISGAPYQRTRRESLQNCTNSFAAQPHWIFNSTDLRTARTVGTEGNLILFCVDASGSMAARTRMQQVKTAVLSLLVDAYQRRDKVGLIAFRGSTAELLLPPTTSTEIAVRRLAELPAGGRTPLAEGLAEALRVIDRERLKDSHRRPLLVVITDARATFGPKPVERAQHIASSIAAQNISSLILDCESGTMRLGLAATLATYLHGEYLPIGEVAADTVTSAIRTFTRKEVA